MSDQRREYGNNGENEGRLNRKEAQERGRRLREETGLEEKNISGVLLRKQKFN